jgi:hypothetical protein
MSTEDMAAFFRKHLGRELEMAKIVTLFQGAAEKVLTTDEANTSAMKT